MQKKAPSTKNYPLWIRDLRVRSRVNQKAAELSGRYGRNFTQEDTIVYLLDQEQARSTEATR